MKWELMSNVALPAVGVALIVFCIASFFFSFGQKFKDTTQVIRGFGVNLEISVLSLFLLIGALLSLTGVFLYMNRTTKDVAALNEQINGLNARVKVLQEQSEKAGRFGVRLNLELPPGFGAADPEKLECWYIISSRPDDWLQVPVSRGITNQSVRVTLLDVGRDDVLQELELRQHGTQKVVGMVQNVYPLQPVIPLR